MKERNRIATSNAERDRLKAGYGLWEAEDRDHIVSTLSSLHRLILSMFTWLTCRFCR
jgi:hypothetical protein